MILESPYEVGQQVWKLKDNLPIQGEIYEVTLSKSPCFNQEMRTVLKINWEQRSSYSNYNVDDFKPLYISLEAAQVAAVKIVMGDDYVSH